MANPHHPASTFWRKPPLWFRVTGLPIAVL
jgi:hypothetical protein